MRAEYARPVVKPPAHEYHGLMAEAWDLLRGDTSGWDDRPFYLELIRRFGEPALDVGCGTGRLLLDYLAEGIEIERVVDGFSDRSFAGGHLFTIIGSRR